MWEFLLWIPALLLLWLGRLARAKEPGRAAGRMAIVFGLIVVSRFLGGALLSSADASWIPSFLRGIPAAYAGIFLLVAGMLFAMGAAAGTILSFYRGKGRTARIAILAAVLLSEFFEPIRATNAISIVGLALLALSTRWTRESAGLRRLGLAILAFLAFLASLVGQTWPEEYAGGALDAAAGLLDFLIIFFALHGFFSSFRLAVGVRARVRKIGRSLLLSHLLAISVPAALVVAFLMLTALAGIAGYRAETAEPYLRAKMERMERAMTPRMERAAAEEATPEPEHLAEDLAAIEP